MHLSSPLIAQSHENQLYFYSTESKTADLLHSYSWEMGTEGEGDGEREVERERQREAEREKERGGRKTRPGP